MTATLSPTYPDSRVSGDPDAACAELDAQLERLAGAAQVAQDALKAQEAAQEPLRARRSALLTEDGDIAHLATEAAAVGFDIDAGELKVGFLTDRLEALRSREQALKAERESTWLAADKPLFEADYRKLIADVAMCDANFRGVALEEWHAVPTERRRWESRWQGAVNASQLEQLVWPLPSGTQTMAYLDERRQLHERAMDLSGRAQRHGVRINLSKPMSAVEATISAVKGSKG